MLSRLYSPCIFFASSFSRVGGMGGWWEANLSNDTHRQPSNQDMENNQKTKIKTKTKILQLFFLPSVTKDFFSKPVHESSRPTRSFGISQYIVSFFHLKFVPAQCNHQEFSIYISTAAIVSSTRFFHSFYLFFQMSEI